jgi:hypothetical protein
VGCELAYRPALFFPDSWEYLGLALHSPFVGLDVEHPSGYPVLVWLLSLDGHSLLSLTIVQHLAGLASAALVYLGGLKMGLGRWISAGLAGLMAITADWVALEQFVMAESLFTLCLVGGAVLVLGGRSVTRGQAAASGLCIAAAVLMRTGAVFVLPVWFVFLLLCRLAWRDIARAVTALLIPLLLYCSLHAADGRGFGFTQSTAWFAYARVAPIARCDASWPKSAALRAICPTQAEQAADWTPGAYLWAQSSPINRVYGGMFRNDSSNTKSTLERFAIETVTRRPLAYVQMIANDTIAAFDPNGGGWEATVRFPPPRSVGPINSTLKAKYVPGYRRHVGFPARPLRAYWKLVHTPRWLLAFLTAAGLLSLLASVVSRRWRNATNPAQTFLLIGMGLGLMIGTIATSSFNMRYVLPSVPLLALGGAVAIAPLMRGFQDALRRFTRNRLIPQAVDEGPLVR